MSEAAAIDPEEAFVALAVQLPYAVVLSIAAQQRFCVDHRYADAAVGDGVNAEGKTAMLGVTLRPRWCFPARISQSPAQIAQMHHAAHEACFIANSVKTEVCCQPVMHMVRLCP